MLPELTGLGNGSDQAFRRLFITGATGFLGSHFLHWRARQRGLFRVLVRCDSAGHGHVRITNALEKAAASYSLPVDPASIPPEAQGQPELFPPQPGSFEEVGVSEWVAGRGDGLAIEPPDGER